MEERIMAEDNAQITADDWGAAMAEQAATPAPDAQPHVFEQLGAGTGATAHNDLDMILDIPVQLTVELGHTKMPIKNLLQLAQGSVVELAGMAGEPLDVLINGFLIAQGEVVVVNDKLGIRLTDIITPSERLRRLSSR
jgi:flagellar motor switch protein FliN/FliY